MQKLWSDLAIDEANRLIFRIDDGQLVISSCMGTLRVSAQVLSQISLQRPSQNSRSRPLIKL